MKLNDEQFFLLLVGIGLNLDNRTTAGMVGINSTSVRENRLKIESLRLSGGNKNG